MVLTISIRLVRKSWKCHLGIWQWMPLYSELGWRGWLWGVCSWNPPLTLKWLGPATCPPCLAVVLPKQHREVAWSCSCLDPGMNGGCEELHHFDEQGRCAHRTQTASSPELSCLLDPAGCLPSRTIVPKAMWLPFHPLPVWGIVAKWGGQATRMMCSMHPGYHALNMGSFQMQPSSTCPYGNSH